MNGNDAHFEQTSFCTSLFKKFAKDWNGIIEMCRLFKCLQNKNINRNIFVNWSETRMFNAVFKSRLLAYTELLLERPHLVLHFQIIASILSVRH